MAKIKLIKEAVTSGSHYGIIDIEAEIMAALAQEITAEIDYKILKELRENNREKINNGIFKRKIPNRKNISF